MLVVKNPHANTGDTRDAGSITGWGTSPEGGHGNPLQCSHLKNSMAEEPDGLQSIGSQRVRHNWSDSALTHAHPINRSVAIVLLNCGIHQNHLACLLSLNDKPSLRVLIQYVWDETQSFLVLTSSQVGLTWLEMGPTWEITPLLEIVHTWLFLSIHNQSSLWWHLPVLPPTLQAILLFLVVCLLYTKRSKT